MKIIKIGTRSSELALWQANTVAKQLEHFGHKTEIVKIDSVGDFVLNKPLYELGVTGVFTKNLDVALLNGQIDIAVHSFKDVPTQLPNGVVQAAILKRGNFNDVIVLKDNESLFEKKSALIATGSLRRRAQWLYRYPNHKVTDLRGNVNTRLQKLQDNDWDGAIFASAGLRRLKKLPQNHLVLDWMVPAPAQGAVMVAALEKDEEILEICKEINDADTEKCVSIEREFLRVLEGGCTAPIGALAVLRNERIKFKGVLFSPDGKRKIEFFKEVDVKNTSDLGEFAANYILNRGGKKLMRQITQNIEKETNIYSTKILSNNQLNAVNKNIGVVMSDFISIRFNRLKKNIINKPIDHAIFTSQNAVESICHNFDKEALDFKNIYAVGKRTKRLVERKIGKVNHVEKSAKELALYLSKNLINSSVTFFCGNLRRNELPTILNENDIEIEEVVCYQTNYSSKKIDDKYKGILFFSPSAVQSFIEKNNSFNHIAFCIGKTTAFEAEKYFKTVKTAENPTVESVINLVNSHFKSL
ncbi:MAG: hydroxymethylbilane synthase [Lutibacter sp.]